MSLRKKLAAAALCIAMLTGCSGLSAQSGVPSPYIAGEKAETSAAMPSDAAGVQSGTDYLAAGRYFDRIARPDVPFEDMRSGRWTQDETDAALRRLRLAAESGSTAAFHAACTEMDSLLDGIQTAYTLAELDSDAHAGDEQRLREWTRLRSLYNRAADGYTGCLAELWDSGAAVMENEFGKWELDELGDYDGETADAVLELSEREDELLSRYAVLSSGDGDGDALAELFVELVSVRSETAVLSGYDSYADYAYAELYSRAYTPEQAKKIWTLAREALVPLYAEKSAEVGAAEENSFDLWKLDCSPDSVRAALAYGAQRMSPEVSAACDYMLTHGLCDLEYSDDKASVGYTVWLPEYKVPYIFNAPYDLYYDYQDAFHEFGHFLTYFYCGRDGSGWDDFDLSELQSQGMEIMFTSFYGDIFGGAADIMRAQTVLSIIGSVIDGAMYDEFQQRAYAEKNLTPERADEIFAELYKSYGFEEYDGFEREWTELNHNFESPFYYISYAVSALPALELFVRAQESPSDAMDAYLRIAAMSSEYYTVADAFAQPGMTDWLNAPDAQTLITGIRRSGVLDF